MPIYEYYCPDNHTIYSFFAKTLAQGRSTPKCPDNPAFRMERILSSFAIGSGKASESEAAAAGQPEGGADGAEPGDDPRMESALAQMEREMAGMDENDPRSMGKMMRRMAELTGESLDEGMEEVVRKLEEGADPESVEEEMGNLFPEEGEPGSPAAKSSEPAPSSAFRRSRKAAPARDPKLYDYE